MIKLNKGEKNKDGNPLYGSLGTASTMGMHFISGPLVGSGLGYLCDNYLFDSFPIGSLIGFVLGVAAGFRNVFADAKLLRKRQEEMNSKKIKNEEVNDGEN